MYQPGEEVHIKGWIRRVGGGKTGDVGPLANAATKVSYVLTDSRDNQVKVGTVAAERVWWVRLDDQVARQVEPRFRDFEVASLESAQGEYPLTPLSGPGVSPAGV